MSEVRAAGGLVTREGRVLAVHRPHHGDWSLPKGKLDRGESFEDAALREVAEETGLRCELVEELEPARYADQRGRPKVVRYWSMRPLGEPPPFAPNDEVDELAWLAPAEAAERLTYAHDRALVAAWAAPGAEVERKFLVARLPDGLDATPRRRIAQGYLVAGDIEVRLRRVDDRTLLTIKAGAGLIRAEEELPIDPDRFDRLWPLTEGRRVEKVRHLVDADGTTVELDVYGGAHEGLAVAEVEFVDEAAARAFVAPDWLGDEVTGDPAYGNARLAS